MISINSLWRNVAEHGFPEAGKPESLIAKQCRLAETKEPIVIVDRIFQYEGLIFFKSGKRLIRGLDPKHIEYLNDSEEAFREMVVRSLTVKETVEAFIQRCFPEMHKVMPAHYALAGGIAHAYAKSCLPEGVKFIQRYPCPYCQGGGCPSCSGCGYLEH